MILASANARPARLVPCPAREFAPHYVCKALRDAPSFISRYARIDISMRDPRVSGEFL
jgi:hypothetical protein